MFPWTELCLSHQLFLPPGSGAVLPLSLSPLAESDERPLDPEETRRHPLLGRSPALLPPPRRPGSSAARVARVPRVRGRQEPRGRHRHRAASLRPCIGKWGSHLLREVFVKELRDGGKISAPPPPGKDLFSKNWLRQ